MPGSAGEKSKEIKIAVDAHENSRTKPLPVVVMLVGLLLVLHVASTKMRAQQATAVERGHSINDLNTSAQVRFGDVSQAVLAYKINPRVTLKQTALLGPHQANKSFKFWRFLSDTIIERKVDRPLLIFGLIFTMDC